MQFLTHLFGENVWPLVWVIAFVELLLVIALVGTGRGRLLIWIVALAVLALGLLALERLWVTPRERLDLMIDQMAQSVRDHDIAGIARHFAPQCHFGSMDRREIERLAAGVLDTLELDRITLSERKTEVSQVRRQATAEFLAVVRGRQAGVEFAPYPTRWILTCSEDAQGQWQVIEIQQLRAFGENRQPRSAPGSVVPP